MQTEGPWDRPGTLYFYGGAFSMFAATPGLMLPEAWAGHPTPAPLRAVPTAEHWFHAVKSTCQADFDWVLAAPNARSAKRRGGPHGENGRRIQLRAGWDEGISRHAMYAANLAKFAVEPFRSLLLLTGNAPLAEDSPRDDRWAAATAGAASTAATGWESPSWKSEPPSRRATRRCCTSTASPRPRARCAPPPPHECRATHNHP